MQSAASKKLFVEALIPPTLSFLAVETPSVLSPGSITIPMKARYSLPALKLPAVT